jgi:ubiquinone/menaquinone biosynthesis C-methylase UbiE
LTSLADVQAARLVVDLGCGQGHDLALLAERAGPQARLIGIDKSRAKLEEAIQQHHGNPQFTFIEQHLATPLPFATGSVDVVYSNNALECIPDKPALLREVHRVLRPAGQVVFAHWDWESQAFDAPDRDLVRRVILAFAEWRQPWMEQVDGWMGRRLWGTFQQTQLFDGKVTARVLINTEYAEPFFGHAFIAEAHVLAENGLLSKRDRDEILANVERLAELQAFFYSITCYVYVGRARAQNPGMPSGANLSVVDEETR